MNVLLVIRGWRVDKYKKRGRYEYYTTNIRDNDVAKVGEEYETGQSNTIKRDRLMCQKLQDGEYRSIEIKGEKYMIERNVMKSKEAHNTGLTNIIEGEKMLS